MHYILQLMLFCSPFIINACKPFFLWIHSEHLSNLLCANYIFVCANLWRSCVKSQQFHLVFSFHWIIEKTTLKHCLICCLCCIGHATTGTFNAKILLSYRIQSCWTLVCYSQMNFHFNLLSWCHASNWYFSLCNANLLHTYKSMHVMSIELRDFAGLFSP